MGRGGTEAKATKFFLCKCGTLNLVLASSLLQVEGSYLKPLALGLKAGPLPMLRACVPDSVLDTANSVCEVSIVFTLQ